MLLVLGWRASVIGEGRLMRIGKVSKYNYRQISGPAGRSEGAAVDEAGALLGTNKAGINLDFSLF